MLGKFFIGTVVGMTTLLANPVMAQTKCDIDRPVLFAMNSWDSSAFQATLGQYILEEGYGCKTDAIVSASLPSLTGLRRGDMDIAMEIWPENYKEAWEKGLNEGTVKAVGLAFPDSVQGWYVPRYLVEGENAQAPDLKSVKDVLKYKELFRDPEEPTKGRFYNGPYGWGAEKINTKKLAAYGLDKDFVNFRSGTSSALAAAIASAYKRHKPFFGFYWAPTWVMGKYDMVKLEEPKYDAKVWENLETGKDISKATAYPVVKVYIGVNTEFAKQAPNIVNFLKKYGTTSDELSAVLSYMQDTKGATYRDAAIYFLKTKGDTWTKWVPQDVAVKLKASLAK